ncbi:trypsin 5G1-like [Wyeomyia smithii]|uniref:trypsin 5G1-like n=1 Tax=Wyeomyia smithii TaxID=174621 RepID=UPI002467E866|nr:trypsin 5G1-like [Wyeomyia smithii]
MFHLALVVVASLELIQPTKCIVGGYKNSVISVPWIVSLSTNHSGPFCGGVLLDQCRILTTAFCLSNGIKPSDILVRLGSDYANGGGKTSTIETVHIHPEFDATTKNYNFAVLEMSESFGKSLAISSIKFRDSSKPPYIGTPQREGCVGDAGGPLTCDGQLVGIISWSRGCAQGEGIGVYADPTAVRNWLRRIAAPF